MNRLTERTKRGKAKLRYDGCYFPDGHKNAVPAAAYKQRAIEKLADYEDAEERGELVRVTRCKDCSRRGQYNECYGLNLQIRPDDEDPELIMQDNQYCSCGEKKDGGNIEKQL